MSNPIDSPYIAWFDLETTGSKSDDAIIEVGFAITDRDLNEVDARSWVTTTLAINFLLTRMEPIVRSMHEKNGLLDALMFTGDFISDVDREVSDILFEYGKGQHVPFAGSGVSHFDRKYIRRDMPKTDSLLSYWALDIGAVRRWLQVWGIETPGSELHGAKTHRALDDVREHIAEAKAIRNILQENQRAAQSLLPHRTPFGQR